MARLIAALRSADNCSTLLQTDTFRDYRQLTGDDVRRSWLITNAGSGSTSDSDVETIVTALARHHVALVGRTSFPADRLPERDALERLAVDTILLFAGDGTINAAACLLDRFAGAALILPGGTMNLLAKRLHGDAAIETILQAACAGAGSVQLPVVEAGPHRAFVALIAGPAAAWGRSRELLRHRRLRRMIAASRLALQRTFGKAVRIVGEPALKGRHQAVVVTPHCGRIDVAAIEARRLQDLARLGWTYLTGDWSKDPSVSHRLLDNVTLAGGRPINALFDGEPVTLDRTVRIIGGTSRLRFITTLPRESEPLDRS